jgi:hypothetical protein
LKKKASNASLVLVLLFSIVAGTMLVDLTTAFDRQYLPELTIKIDGSITCRQGSYPYKEFQVPEFINRTGNTYTLTADVEGYSVRLECSNIIFDGAGHIIYAPSGFDNAGLRLIEVTNVAVKNLEVTGDSYVSLFLAGSNCSITKVKTENTLRINGEFNSVSESSLKRLTLWLGNNIILKCNISNIFLMDWSNSNSFSQNNLLCDNSPMDFSIDIYSSNFWDNGSVGNYWSDYLTKYPNASEIGDTGISDTQYIIGSGNVDHYPLMYPFGAPEITVFGLENATYSGDIPLNFFVSKSTVWMGYSLDGGDNVTIAGNLTLNGLATGFHNLTVYAIDSFGKVGVSETIVFNVVLEPFPVVPVVAVSVVVVALAAGLLVHHRKRKN